jgi:hypothetical protein
VVREHNAKAATLHSFFLALLGTVSPCSWGFDITSLYSLEPPSPRLSVPLSQAMRSSVPSSL